MNILTKKRLIEFSEQHSIIKEPLLSWYKEVKKATWNSPLDIKKRYPSASILKENRICFNIKGNEYRLIAAVNYDKQAVYIRFIGTHTEYDEIDANSV
jgi:mRNA interferase HigB